LNYRILIDIFSDQDPMKEVTRGGVLDQGGSSIDGKQLLAV
jgi:hypothetical protein